ncbi:MAG: ketopantoate reductase family protein [Gammaproteobacteria bacterium]
MNIVILGCGGIGCYFGARLLQARHQVTFIGRGDHLAAIKKHGLKVDHPDFSFNQGVDAVSIDQWVSEFDPEIVDVVLLSVKAMVTTEVAELCARWINSSRKKPFFVSLQNGVDNEINLVKNLGEDKVIGGLTRRIGANIELPGMISATGPAETIIGFWPNSDHLDNSDSVNDSDRGKVFVTKLQAVFNEAGIPTEQSEDIRLQLWKKLVINNGVNALAALLQKKTGAILKDKALADLVMKMMQETAIAAKCDDVILSSEDIQEMYDLICTFDSIKPSMLIDRERGRPLEINEICGAVIERSEKLGVDAPYTRSISTLLQFEIDQK